MGNRRVLQKVKSSSVTRPNVYIGYFSNFLVWNEVLASPNSVAEKVDKARSGMSWTIKVGTRQRKKFGVPNSTLYLNWNPLAEGIYYLNLLRSASTIKFIMVTAQKQEFPTGRRPARKWAFDVEGKVGRTKKCKENPELGKRGKHLLATSRVQTARSWPMQKYVITIWWYMSVAIFGYFNTPTLLSSFSKPCEP
jgi:hypothetical protein